MITFSVNVSKIISCKNNKSENNKQIVGINSDAPFYNTLPENHEKIKKTRRQNETGKGWKNW